MVTSMGICRERYLTVCEGLLAQFGTETAGFKIAKDTGFRECLGYLQQYIIGGGNNSRNHYRFDRYAALLNPWYHSNAFPADESELCWDRGRSYVKLLHIDLGSGPGVFTWAVKDYFDDVFWSPSCAYESMHIGFDHSAVMVDLATAIWEQLAIDSKAVWCSTPESLLAIAERPVQRCDYLMITMGHILIQLHETNGAEIDRFATYICHLLGFDYAAPNIDILIVDAHTGDRPQKFKYALDRLVHALNATRDESDLLHEKWHVMELSPSTLPGGCRAAVSNWREQALQRSQTMESSIAQATTFEDLF